MAQLEFTHDWLTVSKILVVLDKCEIGWIFIQKALGLNTTFQKWIHTKCQQLSFFTYSYNAFFKHVEKFKEIPQEMLD